MSKKNIIIAIVGGAIVGALGTASIIFTAYSAVLITASGLVATITAIITGITPKS
jgi:uncharacterized protein involved in exopolysaccharide biosynthesis